MNRKSEKEDTSTHMIHIFIKIKPILAHRTAMQQDRLLDDTVVCLSVRLCVSMCTVALRVRLEF